MYKQALEFRTGHYFVAYASTVFAIVCGYHCEDNSEIYVTRPLIMEWPRSLLHVVIHWNAPMHYWLKKCKLLINILLLICKLIHKYMYIFI